jgi:hypothetical protein
VGVSLGATYGVPMLMSPPATLWDNGTVRRPLKHGAGKPPRMSGMRLAVAGLGGQVLLSATGLTLGIVSLNAPSVVRLPAEIAACLLLPGIVYFCSLGRLMTLAARVGVSLKHRRSFLRRPPFRYYNDCDACCRLRRGTGVVRCSYWPPLLEGCVAQGDAMSRTPNALLVSTGEPNAGLAKVAKRTVATLFAAQRPVVASTSQIFRE